MKLNEKYAQVRSNILLMLELLTINQAFKILLQEQRHKDLSKLSAQFAKAIAFNAEKRKMQDRIIINAL